MSIEAISWVYENAEELRLTHPQMAVAQCLAWYVNRAKGDAYPSVGTMCQKTRLSRAEVFKVLRQLKEAGVIKERWRGKTVHYRIAGFAAERARLRVVAR